MVDSRQRVGFAQRAAVIEQLTLAAMHGYLTAEELDRRTGVAQQAVDRTDLQEATSGLPPGFRGVPNDPEIARAAPERLRQPAERPTRWYEWAFAALAVTLLTVLALGAAALLGVGLWWVVGQGPDLVIAGSIVVLTSVWAFWWHQTH